MVHLNPLKGVLFIRCHGVPEAIFPNLFVSTAKERSNLLPFFPSKYAKHFFVATFWVSHSSSPRHWDLWYSALQNKPSFWLFSYKMPIHAKVENYLNVMLNPQLFPQLLALKWEASPWILVAKFLMVLELWPVKFEIMKKSLF